MKLSRSAWNNVIIFSVMIIILLINTTNDRLFPEGETVNNKLLLPEHSVILTFTVLFPEQSTIAFERIGKAWQMTSQGRLAELTNQQIEQVMFSWQHSSGLVQAAEILIDSTKGVEVIIALAGVEPEQAFTLYPLGDQLLVFNHQKAIWLAMPAALAYQLIPTF
ncbi:MAG: hypothetical protein QF552_05330 [Litorilituus sp.]|jgi:hypothetical protein|nr:hypothetical protein [Litorilituus sp.]